MSQDDDDLGGGTLVMTPEERPDRQRPHGAVPRPMPPPPSIPTEDTGVDESWDDDASDAPGTFIMNVDHHAQPVNPASPFADASKQSGAWPQVPALEQVVVGSPAARDPSFTSAQTLMGTGNLGAEVDAHLAQIAAQRGAAGLQPEPTSPAFGPPPGPGASIYDLGPQPSYPHDSPAPNQGQPSYPQVDPGAFPRPDSYPHGVPSAQSKGGLGPLLLGAAVGLATVTVVVGGYYGYRALKAPAAAPTTSAAGASAVHVASSAPRATAGGTTTTTSGASTSASPSPASPSAVPSAPPATGSEAVAKAALERFGEGLKKCVAETIHVLPGTAPAIPSSLAWLKSGPYQPGIRDFESSVYTCSRFKLTEPMPFVFQWQSEDTKGKKGSAVAWIDDDRDGKADRAIGFTATLEKRNVAAIGPIESFDASRAIKKR